MSHFNLSIACLCGLFALHLASVEPARSQQDTSALEAVVRSRICPANKARFDQLTNREYGCRTVCTRPELNGTPDCGGAGGFVGYEFQCQQEVNEKNKIITAYNQFVRSCSGSTGSHPTGQPSAPSTSTTLPKPSETPKPNPMAEQIENAKRKVDERRITNRKELEAAEREHKAAIQRGKDNDAAARREIEEARRSLAAEAERIRQQREREAEREREANYIPPGWGVCKCPAEHSFVGKVVSGIRYHGPEVGSCP